jgi:uracil-DNA glycosylase
VTAAAQVQGVRIEAMLARAHPSWHPTLRQGLEALSRVTPDYLPGLLADDFLPSGERLFAAFVQPLEAVRFVLFGEGPYPRDASATGVCFMDGAVGCLWASNGLSKPVNRATSLRNFMKMLLVADGTLQPDTTSGPVMADVALKALAPGSSTIQTLQDLQQNLLAHGFLLLNAALVFRTHVAPVRDAKAWQPFLNTVLAALEAHAHAVQRPPATLVLWGKIAEQLNALPHHAAFPKAISEHPYNLSFIVNPVMLALFGPMHLLHLDSGAV